jgi:4-diphosphocytidyl-2-C-methyl-D-erythritol kinase
MRMLLPDEGSRPDPPRPAGRTTLLAPAKINLTLEVLARQADGYHRVRSVMAPIGVYDRLTAESAAEPSLACDAPLLASDNLVSRALTAAACEPVRMTLQKGIPVGGGLGGGSSDAAAVLRAAMDGALGRFADPAHATDWLAIARALGSDVPFFLVGTAALVEGTGERVTAAGALPSWWCVVVRPGVRVPTAQAYRLLDAERARASPATRPRSESISLVALEALQRADFVAVSNALHNDFHEVVLGAYPEVARAHDALVRAGGTRALLCGSGSCVFALFEREDDARAVARDVDPRSAEELLVAPLVADERWR